MSEHPFIEDGEEGSEEDEERERTEQTRIDVSIGNLSISIENHDREACEEQFYRVYEYILDDVDDWSRAMDNVLTDKGGFQ